MAHFQAHKFKQVAFLQWDNSGQLLFTACTDGTQFNIFRISPHPNDCRFTAVHHLYCLRRGDTTCRVVNASFSNDSRWITVASDHGTVHLFPITPYGGPVSFRTHALSQVVNRVSRHQKSAGMEEISLLRPPMRKGDRIVTNTGIANSSTATLSGASGTGVASSSVCPGACIGSTLANFFNSVSTNALVNLNESSLMSNSSTATGMTLLGNNKFLLDQFNNISTGLSDSYNYFLTNQTNSHYNFNNPRLPPYPIPCTILPQHRLKYALTNDLWTVVNHECYTKILEIESYSLNICHETGTNLNLNSSQFSLADNKIKQINNEYVCSLLPSHSNWSTNRIIAYSARFHSPIPLASCFAHRRLVLPSDHVVLTAFDATRSKSRFVDCLFLVNSDLIIFEHDLSVICDDHYQSLAQAQQQQPQHPQSTQCEHVEFGNALDNNNIPIGKLEEESNFRIICTATGRWNLSACAFGNSKVLDYKLPSFALDFEDSYKNPLCKFLYKPTKNFSDINSAEMQSHSCTNETKSNLPTASSTKEKKKSKRIRSGKLASNEISNISKKPQNDSKISQIPHSLSKLPAEQNKESTVCAKPCALNTENTDVSSTAWISNVEITTHQGPSRRLWMGPQFSFRTYQSDDDIQFPTSYSNKEEFLIDSSNSACLNSSSALEEESEQDTVSSHLTSPSFYNESSYHHFYHGRNLFNNYYNTKSVNLPLTRPVMSDEALVSLDLRSENLDRTRSISISNLVSNVTYPSCVSDASQQRSRHKSQTISNKSGQFFIEAGSYQDSHFFSTSLNSSQGSDLNIAGNTSTARSSQQMNVPNSSFQSSVPIFTPCSNFQTYNEITNFIRYAINEPVEQPVKPCTTSNVNVSTNQFWTSNPSVINANCSFGEPFTIDEDQFPSLIVDSQQRMSFDDENFVMEESDVLSNFDDKLQLTSRIGHNEQKEEDEYEEKEEPDDDEEEDSGYPFLRVRKNLYSGLRFRGTNS